MVNEHFVNNTIPNWFMQQSKKINQNLALFLLFKCILLQVLINKSKASF